MRRIDSVMESEEEGLLLESVWDSEPGIIDYLQVKWQREGESQKEQGASREFGCCG
jgi:hypothetical protein